MRFFGTCFSALLALAVAEPVEYSSKLSGLATTVSLLKNGSSTDVHMQMWGAESAGWASIGLGVQMEKALMFVMYPSANGHDVVVSPRTADGHVMPKLASDIKLEVTNSSIDSKGLMMAEFVCYDCTKWSTGKLSKSSSRQPFVYAVGTGKPVKSDSQSAPIGIHKSKGVFVGNIAQAYMSPSDTVADEPLPSPTLSNTQPSQRAPATLVDAHAILLCLVFFGFLPTGAILLRLPFLKGAAFRTHWIMQVFAFVVAIAGLGIAINLSMHSTRYWDFTNFHQIIGILVVALMFFQALAGVWHHIQFKKILSRTFVSYMHLGLGWIIITLGMLNGCFGFWIMENAEAAGGLGAAGAVILLIMLSVSIWNQWRRMSNAGTRPAAIKHNHGISAPKGTGSSSESERDVGMGVSSTDKVG